MGCSFGRNICLQIRGVNWKHPEVSCTRNILKPSEDVCFDWLVEVTASFCTICVELKKVAFFCSFQWSEPHCFHLLAGLASHS